MTTIPLQSKSENEILIDIINRFENKIIYPFQRSLRFSKLIGNEFHFLKGNQLKVYSESSITEKKLSIDEIQDYIISKFDFDLTGLKIDFVET